MPGERPTFTSDFRRFFGRGLAILLPSVLTLWILWYAFIFVFHNVAVPINIGLRSAVVWAAPRVLPDRSLPELFRVTDEQVAAFRAQDIRRKEASPAWVRREIRRARMAEFWQDYWYLQGAGLVVAITLIYLAGLLLGGIIGKQVYERAERLIARVPGFKQVYPHVKQLVNLVMGDKPLAFKRVVLVEYPRTGIWSMGLVTSSAMRKVAEVSGRPAVTVFIPSTPTPFTGFTINVPEDAVVDLPVSIDEALRFVLTGGVLVPEGQATAPVDPALRALAQSMAAPPPRNA